MSSALYGTCRWPGNPDLCELLLEHGANVDDGESLYHACELGDLRCLRLLLEHGPDDESREWCIRRMIDHENAAGIALFLEHGTDPNHLDWALFRRRSLDCIRVLIEHGADIDRVCEANWLLQRVDGLTPIRIAERNGDPDVTELLLGAGAGDNRTAADVLIGACSRSDRDGALSVLADNPALMASLTPNDHGNLAATARTGNLGAVDLMLDVGFDIEAAADDMMTTGLVYAATNGDVKMARLLLERGADSRATHKHGANALSTAIYCAAHHRSPSGDYPALVELLLDAGMDQDEEMLTFALDHGMAEIVEILAARVNR